MELRLYQQEAIAALYDYLQSKPGNPVVCAPTGSGKSLMIAQVIKDAVQLWQGRVLVVAHVKELLVQDSQALQDLAPDIPFGIYSAGLGSKDVHAPVVIAGIQSAYRNAEELGHFNLVLVDEVHRVPDSGDGQYRTLLEDLKKINPEIRMIGFSATPYRTGTGPICGADKLFTEVCYDIGIKELIVNGYLCRLMSKTTRSAKVDTSQLHMRAGEFIAEEVEALMNGDDEKVALACIEIGEKTEDRKSVLIFCCGVDHAKKVAQMLQDVTGDTNIGTVFAETSDEDRDRAVEQFKSGTMKYLVNVGVYTTGFDAKNCDAVVLLRPTASEVLYVQMVGRGFRISPGKDNCLILDFGGNVQRHGPVDMIQPRKKGTGSSGPPPTKECPACQSIIAPGFKVCPDCGFEFPVKEVKHEVKAGDADVVSQDDYKLEIEEVQYALHKKKGEDNPTPTMRVEYHFVSGLSWVSEWICFEHFGFARDKAGMWWRGRSNEPIPPTVEAALRIIEEKGIKEPKAITYKPEGKYKRIIAYHDLELRPQVEKKEADGNPGTDIDIPF
jgi:DNA repair protein RadD